MKTTINTILVFAYIAIIIGTILSIALFGTGVALYGIISLVVVTIVLGALNIK